MTAEAPDHPQRLPPAVEFIACSRCVSPLASSQFWLSTCAHALCSTCLFPPPLSPPNPPTACEATCPIDETRGVVVPLEEGLRSEAGYFFRPLRSLLSEIEMAAEWQMSNLLGQLEHYKAKSLEQRRALSKVAVELKALRGVKGCVDTLVNFLSLADLLLAGNSVNSSPRMLLSARNSRLPPIIVNLPPVPMLSTQHSSSTSTARTSRRAIMLEKNRRVRSARRGGLLIGSNLLLTSSFVPSAMLSAQSAGTRLTRPVASVFQALPPAGLLPEHITTLSNTRSHPLVYPSLPRRPSPKWIDRSRGRGMGGVVVL